MTGGVGQRAEDSAPSIVRVLAEGYYDGATDGIAFDPAGCAYHFSLLDEDDGHDMRVFYLAAIKGISEADIDSELRHTGLPRKPFALLPVGDLRVSRILEHCVNAAVALGVGATEDVLDGFIAWTATSMSLEDARQIDWFARLGISRERRAD
jgi:hypothetical protein